MKWLTRIAFCISVTVPPSCGGDAGVGPSRPSTDTMTWEITNSCNSTVDLRFFDRTYGVASLPTLRPTVSMPATISCSSSNVTPTRRLPWGHTVIQ